MIIKNGKRLDGFCVDSLPIGTLQPYLGLKAPNGYLICDGSLVSKTVYPDLYAICGSLFGVETSTHFYLPDLRGKTIGGYDENDTAMNTIGKLLGQKTHVHTTGNHTLTEAEMPEHKHLVWANLQSSRLNGSPAWNTVVTANDEGTGITGGNIGTQKWSNSTNNAQLYIHDYSDLTGGSQPHNHGDTGSNTNYQPTMVANWIVKAKMIVPVTAYVEDNLNSNSTINALSANMGKALSTNISSLTNTVDSILTSLDNNERFLVGQLQPLNGWSIVGNETRNYLYKDKLTGMVYMGVFIMHENGESATANGALNWVGLVPDEFLPSVPYVNFGIATEQPYGWGDGIICKTNNQLGVHVQANATRICFCIAYPSRAF